MLQQLHRVIVLKIIQVCADTGDVNCQTSQTFLQVCSDVHHAKLVCRSYCNLCDLVDGHCSDWSAWSKCVITCGNGTIARSRTCTNPAPANLGLNCVGPGIEYKNCSLDPCPVHGGWSAWTSWGTCSASCGVGIQRRDRTCTNPPPQYFGNHCFGDVHEDRLCYPGHCADGGWSAWTNWGSCSKSCGNGIRTRGRVCNNPTPSLLGSYCSGPATQSDTCGVPYDPAYEIVYENGSCCLEYHAKNTNHVFLLWYGSTVRLCDGEGPNHCSPHKGRVEVSSLKHWGTMCDNVWDTHNYATDFFCRSIGLCTGIAIPSVPGHDSSPIYFGVNCTGSEGDIGYTCHEYRSNCTHADDLTVLCK